MSGKRSLVAGKPRLLSDHRSLDGREYHRAYTAIEATFDLRTALGRMEAGRCAARWVVWRTALRELEAARMARATGRGRRPNERTIKILTKREMVADLKFASALAALERLVPKRSPLNGGGWPA
jgi:hypothetical protein